MTHTLTYDLSTFAGFNFRDQSLFERLLTAQEVIDWNHDRDGEAEFWPCGNRKKITLIFIGQNSVTASELIALDKILAELGGDDLTNYLKIYHATQIFGTDLCDLKVDEIENRNLHIILSDSLTKARREAAYELFEAYWPDEYLFWRSCKCEGLILNPDRLLNSHSWGVEEIAIEDQVALIIHVE